MRLVCAGALLFALGASAAPRAHLRQALAEVALAQAEKQDPAWEEAQRDCAGYVRFAFRAAYRRLAPSRLERPLWSDDKGRPTDFADARTLLAQSFRPLGRGEGARARLRTGDLVAFRQERAGDEVFHLMLVLAPGDKAHAEPRVAYHPGEKDAAVRVGRLSELSRDAPAEWRPAPENPAFLGFYRFKEWLDE